MILFHGSLQSENFGDVLLAEICLGLIREITDEPIRSYAVMPKLRSQLGLAEARPTDLARARLSVMTGGGFFQFMDSGHFALRRFVRKVGPAIAAQALGRPTGLLGVGAGPIPAGLISKGTARLFRRADVACVRDNGSADAVGRLKGAVAPAVTGDLALTLERDSLGAEAMDYAAAILARAQGRPPIGVHLSALPTASADYRAIYRVLEPALLASGAHVFLLEDHPGENSGQRAAQKYLAALLGERSTVVPYGGTRQLSAVLARLESVLTDKLHVGIVAATMGTEPFAIARHVKNRASYEQFGIPGNCILLKGASEDEIRGIVDRFLVANERIALPDKVHAGAIENRARLHAFLRAA